MSAQKESPAGLEEIDLATLSAKVNQLCGRMGDVLQKYHDNPTVKSAKRLLQSSHDADLETATASSK